MLAYAKDIYEFGMTTEETVKDKVIIFPEIILMNLCGDLCGFMSPQESKNTWTIWKN